MEKYNKFVNTQKKVTIQEKLGIIQLRKDQKMNYSLRKSRSVQKGKKRKRLHFC